MDPSSGPENESLQSLFKGVHDHFTGQKDLNTRKPAPTNCAIY